MYPEFFISLSGNSGTSTLMVIIKEFLRNNYMWIIFLVLVSAGSLSAELINGRMEMVDLEVYYTAAERLVSGGELYRTVEDDPYEHYVYKYSPPAAILFVPFIPLGLTLSKYLYWVLLTLILGVVLYTLKRIFLGNEPINSRITVSFILGIIIIGTHFFRELHLGQVNLLLLGLYVYALALLDKHKAAGFGALIAISIFIKPFGLIFIPLLIIMGRFRELLYFSAFTVLMFFAPMVFYSDPGEYFSLFSSWFQELSIELGDKQELVSAGNHTIFSILARYTPLAMIPLTGAGQLIYQLITILILALILLWFYLKSGGSDRAARLYIILIAMIPLLAFTSYNAFIFTLPLVVYLLFKFREMTLFFKIVFVISCLLIGGNIYDVVGSKLFDFFWSISVFSWGTIGLLFVMFAGWNKLLTSK